MSVLRLLASDSYITVNRVIAERFGLEAAVLLGELASEATYYEQGDLLTEDGWFYSTVENVQARTTLTKYQQGKALKTLNEAGIVDVARRGLPARRYIRINEQQVVELFDNKKSKNSPTVGEKTSQQEVKKLNGNNKEIKDKEVKINKKESKSARSFDAIIEEYTQSDTTRELLGEWLQNRKAKRAAMTDNAIRRNLQVLDKCARDSGMSVDDYLAEVIRRGWQAFYPISSYGRSQQPRAQQPTLTEQEQQIKDKNKRENIAALEEFTF